MYFLIVWNGKDNLTSQHSVKQELKIEIMKACARKIESELGVTFCRSGDGDLAKVYESYEQYEEMMESCEVKQPCGSPLSSSQELNLFKQLVGEVFEQMARLE